MGAEDVFNIHKVLHTDLYNIQVQHTLNLRNYLPLTVRIKGY